MKKLHLHHSMVALAALSAAASTTHAASNTIMVGHLDLGARANDEKMKPFAGAEMSVLPITTREMMLASDRPKVHIGGGSSDLGMIDGTATPRVKFSQFGAKHHMAGAVAAAFA